MEEDLSIIKGIAEGVNRNTMKFSTYNKKSFVEKKGKKNLNKVKLNIDICLLCSGIFFE